MLWLVFRHLIPQRAFLRSQRPIIRQPDLHGRAAEKFLQLTPICCLEARTSNLTGLNSASNPATQPSSNSLPTFLVGLGRPAAEDGLAIDTASEAIPEAIDFQSYLIDAKKAVRDRFEATRCWVYDYDGLNPPAPPTEMICDSEASTPYGSAPVSLTEEEDKEFWNALLKSENNEHVKVNLAFSVRNFWLFWY